MTTQLTSSGGNARCTWSPDGKQIAYESTAGSRFGDQFGIWIMGSRGQNQVYISSHHLEEWRDPNWSPDGSHIIHVRRLDVVGSEIFVMDVTGGGATRLTNNTYIDMGPRYSPDGSQIVLVVQGFGGSGVPKLMLANADGSNARLLSNTPADQPAWSPDGTEIVFVRYDTYTNDPANGVLWVIDIQSGAESQLTFASRDMCQ